MTIWLFIEHAARFLACHHHHWHPPTLFCRIGWHEVVSRGHGTCVRNG